MSEIKKDSNLLSWEDGKKILSNSALADFDSRGDYFRPAKGQKFVVKNPFVRKLTSDETKGFGLVEVYEAKAKGEFLGYLTFNKLRGRKYIGVEVSKTKGTKYAKYDITNDFCKVDTVTLGGESMKKLFEKERKMTCAEVTEQQVPFFNTDLSAEVIKLVPDKYYSLTME